MPLFSAAVKAIDLALVHIEQSRNTDYIIFSDSLSVLQSLHNRHIENRLLLDVLLKHNDLADLNHIVFCWLPSHVGGGRVVRWCLVNFQCRGVLQFGLQ